MTVAKRGAKNPTKNPKKHRSIVREIISNAAAVKVPNKAAPKEPITQGYLLPNLFEIGPESRDPKNIDTNIEDA